MVNVLPILKRHQSKDSRCTFCLRDRPLEGVLAVTPLVLVITTNEQIPEIKLCFYCATNLTAQLTAQLDFLVNHKQDEVNNA